MVSVNLKSLVGRLNAEARRALEGAAGLCLSRTHYNVEIEHWLLKLLEVPGSTMETMLRRFDVDLAKLSQDLTRALDRLKTGNSRPPSLSPNVVDLAREAWLVASLDHEASETGSGQLLIALLATEALTRQAKDASREFEKVVAETLKLEYAQLAATSSEAIAGSAKVAPVAGARRTAAPRRLRQARRTSISSRSTSPQRARRARSIRCSGATTRSAR
jgi:type VI secretion system protein VasG